MTQAVQTPSPGKTAEEVFNEGYRAQAKGFNMNTDNPYSTDDPNHWTWRKGFIQAHQDSN